MLTPLLTISNLFLSLEGSLGVMARLHWFMNLGIKQGEYGPGLFHLNPRMQVHAYCLIGLLRMFTQILVLLCNGELLQVLM